MKKLVQVSVFYRNNEPDGLGLTFRSPEFSPRELTEMFAGDTIKQYIRDSDANLGTALVETYLAQLDAIAAEAKRGPLSVEKAILAAMNIIYLAERGFIPNSEFSGPMFVQAE